MREQQSVSRAAAGNGFARSAFAQLIAGTGGRIARVVAGVVLIGVGKGFIGGTTGTVVAIVGLAPLAAGAFDVCLVAPLFGAPFQGRDIRVAGR
jgi:hypothetical protein